MKQVLTRNALTLYYYKGGERVEGAHSALRGDVSGLRGDVSGIYGDVSGLSGDVSDLSGNVSPLRGNVSGLRGNVDDAGLTDEERAAGVDVSALIEGGKK